MPRPADECPYRKPFSPDFKGCPAFQPRQFIPLDTLYQPLTPVITCRHLTTRTLPQRYRWYAACAIGDATARQRWADELGADRLARLRILQHELGGALAPFNGQLWELKGKQLRALRDGEDSAVITAQLNDLAGRATAAVNDFMESNDRAFAEVDLPLSAAKPLLKAAMDHFLDSRFATEISFEVPDDVLKQFPASARAFFRPSPDDVPEMPS